MAVEAAIAVVGLSLHDRGDAGAPVNGALLKRLSDAL